MKGSTQEVSYDRYGRMQYHPDYHPNHGKPWKQPDQVYLIQRYDLDGSEQVSFALGRTIHTVMTRAYELRKAGLMPKPATQIHHRCLRGLGE